MKSISSTILTTVAFILFFAECRNLYSSNIVTYSIGNEKVVREVYPDTSWLPKVYSKYYHDICSTITTFTKSSLTNDMIEFDSVKVTYDKPKRSYRVRIHSSDKNAIHYKQMHPQFINNYFQALKGVKICQSQKDSLRNDSCWNNNNTDTLKPWAFFPQFGLPMVNQKCVLLLNYPPTSALCSLNYLNTFTMKRWSQVLRSAGIAHPVLYETIVDVRPIAAPGNNTSQFLPDAQTYFNDSTGTTGGYYITPHLRLMLDPPGNRNRKYTLPIVVLGGPARKQWSQMTGVKDTTLNTGTVLLPGSTKKTPFIIGNHPDMTTYQSCSKSPSSDSSIIFYERIDLTIASWMKYMATDPGLNPDSVLKECKKVWGVDISTANACSLCVRVKLDDDSRSEKCPDFQSALKYCANHNNMPCATKNCECDNSVK